MQSNPFFFFVDAAPVFTPYKKKATILTLKQTSVNVEKMSLYVHTNGTQHTTHLVFTFAPKINFKRTGTLLKIQFLCFCKELDKR